MGLDVNKNKERLFVDGYVCTLQNSNFKNYCNY